MSSVVQLLDVRDAADLCVLGLDDRTEGVGVALLARDGVLEQLEQELQVVQRGVGRLRLQAAEHSVVDVVIPTDAHDAPLEAALTDPLVGLLSGVRVCVDRVVLVVLGAFVASQTVDEHDGVLRDPLASKVGVRGVLVHRLTQHVLRAGDAREHGEHDLIGVPDGCFLGTAEVVASIHVDPVEVVVQDVEQVLEVRHRHLDVVLEVGGDDVDAVLVLVDERQEVSARQLPALEVG